MEAVGSVDPPAGPSLVQDAEWGPQRAPDWPVGAEEWRVTWPSGPCLPADLALACSLSQADVLPHRDAVRLTRQAPLHTCMPPGALCPLSSHSAFGPVRVMLAGRGADRMHPPRLGGHVLPTRRELQGQPLTPSSLGSVGMAHLE